MHFSQVVGQVFGLQAKVEMIRFNICISLLLFCFTQGFAATDVYVSAGTAKPDTAKTLMVRMPI
jgi:hypothetical protein